MRDKALEPGTPGRIGRYEIQRLIGRGAMGVVYQAQDTVLRRTVALKTISIGFAVDEHGRRAFERRFLDEARAAAALAHPGIVVVYDFGSDPKEKLLYMALEFVRGKTLEDILAAGMPLDWEASLATAVRVAEALHHAHQHRIVHRDIKPANIMVLGAAEAAASAHPDPEQRRRRIHAGVAVKIMDFGIAKIDRIELSMAGQVFGSPAYMSPEQAQAQPVDARSDIFSLGAVLYELLTGKKAFGGSDLQTILMRVACEEPVPVSRLVAGVPPVVDLVLARALAKSRDERYPNAKAIAEDLEDVLDGRPPRHTRVAAKGPATVASAPGIADTLVGHEAARPAGAGVALSLPAGKTVSLQVVEGAERGRVYVLATPRLLIGRAGGGVGADVELQDPEASRTHAAVECHGDRVLVRDLGSTNGTFIGANRVVDAPLENGGEFRIGRTRIKLAIAAAS